MPQLEKSYATLTCLVTSSGAHHGFDFTNDQGSKDQNAIKGWKSISFSSLIAIIRIRMQVLGRTPAATEAKEGAVCRCQSTRLDWTLKS